MRNIRKKRQTILIALFMAMCSIGHAQWTASNAGTNQPLMSISFPAADTGYVLNDQAAIRKTTDAAVTWSAGTSPSPNAWRIYFTTGLNGFALTDNSIERTTDGAQTWNTVFSDNGLLLLFAIDFPTPSTGYVAAGNGTGDSTIVLKTTNGGTTWARQSGVVSLAINAAIEFTSVTTGFLASDNSIYRTMDGGLTWNLITTLPVTSTINDLEFPNATTGFAVANDGVYKTSDGGTTWNALSVPASNIDYKAQFVSAQTGFVCGGNGFSSGWVIKTVDGGTTWTNDHSSTYSYYDMVFPTSQIGYGCGDNGSIIKTQPSSGVVESQKNTNVILYPNPATDKVNVHSLIPLTRIEITDVLGKVILAKDVDMKTSVEVELTGLANGVYTLIGKSADSGFQSKLFTISR